MSADRTRVRLILADGGDFMVQDVAIPSASLEGYERLIDCLREDAAVLRELYIDHQRLVVAQILED